MSPIRMPRLPRTAMAITAVTLVAVVALTALIAPPLVAAAANTPDTGAVLRGPSAEHLLGTDNLGRDILARVLYASRLSLLLAAGATAIAAFFGILLGALPAILGRRGGRFVTAALNTAVAFPGLLLVLFLAVIFGVGAQGAMLAVGFAQVPFFARITQTLTASVAGKDYVAAARLIGVGRFATLRRYVLPNIAEPLIVNVSLTIGQSLLVFSGLSFLGLGVQSPEYDWGRMLGDGLSRIYSAPPAALAPGIAVIIAGLAFNLAGDSIAKAAGSRRTRVPKSKPATTVRAPAPAPSEDAILAARNLEVWIPGPAGWVRAVNGVDFEIGHGEIVGVVGESGSGKSLMSAAAVRMLPYPAQVTAESLAFDGHDLRGAETRRLRRRLGTGVSMIFQDPMNALNPSLRVGRQITEAPRFNTSLARGAAARLAVALLEALHIPRASQRIGQYPHEFSGGMRQRAVIAMGLSARPRLIVADEPTTALDVTVQKRTLQILRRAQHDLGASILFISHDLGVVSQLCDRVLVMYAGGIVEELPVGALADAAHPYTRALLGASPDMSGEPGTALASIPGLPPQPGEITRGCSFASRCAFATDDCRTHTPPRVPLGPGRTVACFHPQSVDSVASDVSEVQA
ncbi:dipeptide/oligopeptide/nickel ABC transporter permease/ATP-binding protein [Microbacterium aerolatum]|uniref:dipeptide/oligopeptide/nickel ABC transporter permease/ATP-binding protein n=1 Tax=Microbacterium aerolatum TaxID=153731 RepID=UPI00384E6E6C